MIHHLLQSAKFTVRDMLASRLFRYLRRSSTGQGIILMYHSLCRDREPLPDSATERYFLPNIALSVRESRFREQMRFLKQHFEVISLEESLLRLRSVHKKPGKKQFAVVTFDDGYRDNLEIGVPILEELGIPYSIFLTTGYLDRTWSPWWFDLEEVISGRSIVEIEWKGERLSFPAESVEEKTAAFGRFHDIFRNSTFREHRELLDVLGYPTGRISREFLSWDDVREMSKSRLVSFGAHTVHHPVLSKETPETVLQELEGSRKRIQQEIGQTVRAFAYPYGDQGAASQREFSLVASTSLDLAVTTRFGHVHREHSAHLYAVPRIAVDYFDSAQNFRWKALGVDSLLKNRASHIVVD